MTTLYKPVLIETAEQAAALPVGTIAFDRPTGRGIPEASVKNDDGSWTGTLDGGKPYEALQMVGDQALVPIEAEEERHVIAACEMGAPGSEQIIHEHRLVTPWTPKEQA